MHPSIRVGVDVGGTFTDFVLVDERRGLIFTGKRLTTPDDPSVAITDGLERLVGEAETEIGRIHGVVHGTTLVANTIIERTGAKVGLITTRGFRDVLEMGRETRYDLYDLFLERPPTLVPRYLRREIGERIGPEGDVLLPFDANEFRAVAQGLVDEGVEAIAVAFMHAYRNDVHERLAKDILAEAFADIHVTLSSEVAPEIREFERTSTACANAYVQPLMQRYLSRLDDKLKQMGFTGNLFVMLSGGGVTTIRAAAAFPIRLIESGPAAGAMAASYYGRLTGTDNLISFDMGGTTAKMCLIHEGRPEHAHEFECGRVRRFRKGSGLPLKVPVVEMIEIGAGGGSIARVDAMGLLKVGPDSAGARPGPVCYGQGGVRPTVTDADLLLGYLDPVYFLGGEMRLDLSSVEGAMAAHVAEPLGLSIAEATRGIHSVVNENMATATRMHITEKGRDPRRYSMIAFGGAGPVHAYALAKLLKIRRILVPFGAGVTSALGFLVAAPAIDFVRSYVSRLETIDWDHLRALYEEMESEARALLVETGASPASIEMQRSADMRHVGQGFEVTARVPDGHLGPQRLDEIRDGFLATYERLFERRITDVPIETMSWRLSASAPAPPVTLDFGDRPPIAAGQRKGERHAFFPDSGFVSCPVYDRYGLAPGTSMDGPAIIEERDSTTVVGADARVVVDDHLNLVIDIG